LLWMDEQERVGEIDPWNLETKKEVERFEDVPPPSMPTAGDYRGLLAAGPHDRQKERYLLIRAWWAGNDKRRESKDSGSLSEPEIVNLRVLVASLDESDNEDRIMKAEALRELGMFHEAEAVLARPVDPAMARAVSLIRDLCRQRISIVTEIRFA